EPADRKVLRVQVAPCAPSGILIVAIYWRRKPGTGVRFTDSRPFLRGACWYAAKPHKLLRRPFDSGLRNHFLGARVCMVMTSGCQPEKAGSLPASSATLPMSSTG